MTKIVRCVLVTVLIAGASAACQARPRATPPIQKITHTDAEWQARLSPFTYQVLRHGATEIAFTGSLWDEHRSGTFTCAGCGLELFSSRAKFDSGTGWPSFWQPEQANRVVMATDTTFGVRRDEVLCARCGGHLGHVFDDGPAPTGLRYCINSAALSFVPGK